MDWLKAVRVGHRGVLTRLTNELDELLSLAPDEAKDKVGRLKILNQQSQNKLTILQKHDDDILALCNIDKIEHEIKDSDTINLKVLDYKTRINEFLTLTTNPVSPSTLAVMPPTVPTPSPAKARLPKLELHKFKGSVMSWTPFWDTLKSAVHENPSLSKIDKFNYLHSLLEGAASQVIQGLPLTDSNYDTAVSLLQERFGDPQTILSPHMDELLKLPKCTVDRQQL